MLTAAVNTVAENQDWIKIFGLKLNLDRVAFTIPIGDGYDVYWYAVIIAFGLLLAMLYGFKRAPKFGIDTDKMIDVVLVSFICAFVGARAYYLIFDAKPLSSFSEIFAVRNGGLAIYGGVIGAFVSGYIMCRVKKVKVLAMYDLAALGFLIGQGIGRWGNFFNQEAYGTHTDSIFGMTGNIIEMNYAYGSSVGAEPPVHPCFLYESFFCLLGFALLHFVSKKRKFDGQIISLYMIWYGVVRFFIEGLRTDSLPLGALRVSQVVSFVLVVAGIALYIFLQSRGKKAAVEQGEYDQLFSDFDEENGEEIDEITDADEVDDAESIADLAALDGAEATTEPVADTTDAAETDTNEIETDTNDDTNDAEPTNQPVTEGTDE